MNQLSPLLDAGYLEETIRRHFEPLLDPAFVDILKRHYPTAIRFEVDGRTLPRLDVPRGERAAVAVRLGRRRTPSPVGFIERHAFVPPDAEGIAISTLGKVIKRGWEWLGLAPTPGTHIGGLIEVPDLAACLTLSKNDFIRSGPRGASYLAYRKAIQEVVSRQLAAWGDDRTAEARPHIARLERDLERVLEALAEDFPLLRALVDRRTGGQKRLPMPGRGNERVPMPLFTTPAVGHESVDEPTTVPGADVAPTPHPSEGAPPSPEPVSPPLVATPGRDSVPPQREPTAHGEHLGHPVAAADTGETVTGRRRPARYGLLVQFESRPEDSELARLVDSTIWINDAHPAHTRAAASRSLGYHTAVAVAFTLARLAVEPPDEHPFITQFLAHWGKSHTIRAAVRRRLERPRRPTGGRGDGGAR